MPGDGSDGREPDAKLRIAMQVAREKYDAVVWQETHMSRKEMNAARGVFKRVHGFESFGTEGYYSRGGGRRARHHAEFVAGNTKMFLKAGVLGKLPKVGDRVSMAGGLEGEVREVRGRRVHSLDMWIGGAS